MDAATITAVFTGCAAVIGAIGVVVRIVVTRPRLPVAEELLEQIDELRGDLLAVVRWAHRAVVTAASQGVELEPPPDVMRGVGERAGERHNPNAGRGGWRSSVTAQTGEQPLAMPGPMGPDTVPNRRRPMPPTSEKVTR